VLEKACKDALKVHSCAQWVCECVRVRVRAD
jgi:hypothetical protein